MVRQDRIGRKIILTQPYAAFERCYDQVRYGLVSQVHRPPVGAVKIPVHPNESCARRKRAGRRILGLRKAAVEMARHEEPLAWQIVVRATAPKLLHAR